MLRISALLLLLMLLSHACLLKLGIIVHYEWNKAYIAQNLCENRDKPALKCCGKCYLRKQLARADKGAAKNADRRILKEEMSPFLVPKLLCILPAYATVELPRDGYRMPYAKAVAQRQYHPPG